MDRRDIEEEEMRSQEIGPPLLTIRYLVSWHSVFATEHVTKT